MSNNGRAEGQSYVIANPIRDLYRRLVDAIGDAVKYDILLTEGLGVPGQGTGFFVSYKDSVIDASILETSLVKYFGYEDFKKVFPSYEGRN